MSGDFPVIDIAAVRQPQVSAAARLEIVRQVASACEKIGFFAVTGHGMPGTVIADLVAQSYAFFDLPLAEKSPPIADAQRHPPNPPAASGLG
jgi:isopenicillin N synthase-like dioxygenase